MKFVSVIVVFLPLLLSCKKDKTPIIHDYSHYEGNYYGENTHTDGFYLSSSEVISDRVMRSSVDNGRVNFMGDNFDIDHPQTTDFSIFSPDYSHDVFLSFGAGFGSLYYNSTSMLGGGGSASENFSSIKTELPVTGDTEHPLKDQLEGTYILSVTKSDYLNNIDTSYQDTLTIQISGFSALLDNNELAFAPFHSYLHSDVLIYTYDEHRIKDLYWTEDSIYLNHKTMYGIFGGSADTVHYIYSGVKL